MAAPKTKETPRAQTLSMKDLCSPTGSMSSTLALPVSMPGMTGGHKTFSIPPFFYYAEKARLLAQHGYESEEQADKDKFDVHQHVLREIRDIARKVYSSILVERIDASELSGYVSGLIQHALLTHMLQDGIFYAGMPKDPQRSISMNATRAKKNITIPSYLMERLIRLYGTGVSSQINEIALNIKKELDNANMLDDKGVILGAAGNSSWARKVHNSFLYNLCQMTPHFKRLPRWDSVRMNRVFEIETAYQRNSLITS